MRKDIVINIDVETSNILTTDTMSTIGVNAENLQGHLIFKLSDTIVGVGYLLLEYDGKTSYIQLKTNEEHTIYYTIIKSSILRQGISEIQLRITEHENEYGIPVFKSAKYQVVVASDIDAFVEQPDDYPAWIDTANAKILEIDEKIYSASESAEYAKEQGDYAKEQGDLAKENNLTFTNAENTRVSNESARKASEVTRASQETARQTNENTRQQQENIRNQNEETRIVNERDRETTFAQYEKIIEDLENRIAEFEKYDYIVKE